MKKKIGREYLTLISMKEFFKNLLVYMYLQHFDSKKVGFSNCFAIDKRQQSIQLSTSKYICVVKLIFFFNFSVAYNPYFTRRQLQLQPQARQHQHQDVPAVIKGLNHLLI